MRTILIAAACMAIAACGPSSNGPTNDGPSSIDGPIPLPLTPTDLTCVTHTRSTSNANGTSDQRTYFALVDGITRDSDWAVEQCDQRVTVNGVDAAACPAGSTCTDSGAALPAAPECVWTRRGGTFTADGKLHVSCGTGSTSGSQVVEIKFQTVRIWK